MIFMAKKKTKKKSQKKITKKQTGTKRTSNSKKPAPAPPITRPPAGAGPAITPMPTAGPKVLEFEEALDRSLAAGDTKKRGPGRPRKESEQPPPEIDVKIIAQAVQIPFDLWSISQGVPGLKISNAESVMLAKPAKQLIDHYLPQIPEIAWAWISLSAVSYSIMKSRLILIAEIRKNKAASMSGSQGDAARGSNSQTFSSVPQGHGGPHPSAVFPTIDAIKNPET